MPPTGFKAITNEKSRFYIFVPTEWIKKGYGLKNVIEAAMPNEKGEAYYPNIIASVNIDHFGISLEEMVNGFIELDKKFSQNFRLLNKETYTIKGEPAKTINYLIDENGETIRNSVTVYRKNRNIVVFSYSVLDRQHKKYGEIYKISKNSINFN
ncbi:MAG: hypothetical protein JJV98_09260 [Desulfosarcina sp.]|nr:hypothetical protein [Desulfobacterales bacterium]